MRTLKEKSYTPRIVNLTSTNKRSVGKLRTKNLASAFTKYSTRVFGLFQALSGVKDGRKNPSVKLDSILSVLTLGIAIRTGSFLSIENKIRNGIFKRLLRGTKLPSADTITYALERVSEDDVRQILDQITQKVRRNKAVSKDTIGGYQVTAIDGTGVFSTEIERFGKDAHPRGIHDKKDGKRYHEQAISICRVGNIPLIYEMKRIPKGSCEITAAYELVKELYKRQGHFCDIIVADALYAKANFINTVRKCHMDAIIRVKQENYEIIKDMNGLCKNREPDVVLKNVRPQKKAKGTYYDVKIWDIDGFTSWENVEEPLRCLKVEETIKIKQNGKTKTKTYITYFVTTCDKSVSAKTIWEIGHRRWDIEDSAFYDLKINWHFDHIYTHNANATQVLWLLFAITYNVYRLFVNRNLRSEKYKRQPMKELASKILIDLTHITITLKEIIRQVE